jgi:hypothetical protein
MAAPDYDAAFERFLADLDSGQLFIYARNSHAGRTSPRGRGWMKQLDERTADLMILMGRMARRHRALLDVSKAVLRGCNPHASRAEWCAALFENALGVLRGQYDDVERRSGPEVGRLSDYVRPYTRAEKLLVLEVLRSIADEFIGIGWAAKRAAEEMGIMQQICDLAGCDAEGKRLR